MPALIAIGATVPAAILLPAMLVRYLLADPERLLDALYVAAFCALGYWAG